ncbi:MAG TPA: carboxypeptidase-like regulatory domain-containing protein [Gemmatimonadales bacterium]|nr:carboxypeptidase-like regulatory domain-containing protein [Gemmatimonadales bacterium]
MRGIARLSVVLACFLCAQALLPTLAHAQATLAGLARDTSGAVLPGVSVEASSPVLIEKVRAAASDETGRYTIPNLRPGVYRVTFTLPGFKTVVREGVELVGSTVVTLNADMG